MQKLRIWIFLVIVGFSNLGKAQVQIPTKLYPIEPTRKVFGPRFVYDRQLISDPAMLQIPILQSKDPEASLAFLKYKQLKQTNRILQLIPAGISIYTLFNRDKISDEFFWISVGSSFVISTVIDLKANKHLARSINRYNQVVTGVSIQTTPTGNQAIGLSFAKSI
jgi:hypothetical protein